MCFQLGIPLLLASRLAAERLSPSFTSRRNGLIGSLAVILTLVVYYFSLPGTIDDAEMIRFVQWNVAAHLLVAFLPYLRLGETNGFWQFNLALALRMLASVFFTAVLFGGLSVALLALDTLFEINLDQQWYMHVWTSLIFVFNTWYFLGGVPSAWRELEANSSFPKIVQVFGQYILAPLVMVYQAILTAYLVKIIITTIWPSSWTLIYGRTFHLALIPSVIMLLMAIGQRIGQYGITEMRYLLTVMAVWLGVMAILGSIRGRISIKTIPASLLLLAVLTAFGPLGAATISRRSQLARLDSLLADNGRLAEGIIVPSEEPPAVEDSNEITAVLKYLFKFHGPQVLAGRCDQTLSEKLEEAKTRNSPGPGQNRMMRRAVAAHANLPYEENPSRIRIQNLAFTSEEPGRATEIRGYDFSLQLKMERRNRVATVFEDNEYVFTHDAKSETIVLTRNSVDFVTVDLAPLLLRLITHNLLNPDLQVPAELLEIQTRGDLFDVKQVFTKILVTGEIDREVVADFEATAFVRTGD